MTSDSDSKTLYSEPQQRVGPSLHVHMEMLTRRGILQRRVFFDWEGQFSSTFGVNQPTIGKLQLKAAPEDPCPNLHS